LNRLEPFLHDILQVLDALSLERVVLAAHSTGAHYAILFAGLHPERIAHLVCMSTDATLQDTIIPQLFIEFPSTDEQLTYDFMREYQLGIYNRSLMPDWFFHNQMYAIMQTSAEALKGDQEISARTWDDDRYARRILPTLAHVTLAWGTEDEFYPLSKWQVHELLEFSSTEAVLLPGKHAPHFETPGVQAVADFINGIIDPQPATACNARGADLRHDTPKPDVIVAGLHTFLLLVAVLTLAAVGQVTVRFAKSCLTARLSFPTTGAQGRGGAFLM